MEKETTLGERLRSRRIKKNMTLAEVAEGAELSLPYISNLERGIGNPTIDALNAIAEVLDVELSFLVGGENPTAEDLQELVLKELPKSLSSFANTKAFKDKVKDLAGRQKRPVDEVRAQILVGMVSAPRRSKGEPSEDDWRRLLDVYSLILSDG